MSDSSWATETGLETLVAIITAQEEWRRLTLKQRQCLLDPSRPAHKRTVYALFGKGLLNMAGPHSFPLSEYGAFVVKVRHQK